jgi:hypothetical protein
MEPYLAALMPGLSKAASISCRMASGAHTHPKLSCLRTPPADNNDAVGVIGYRLRGFIYYRQMVLGATLTLQLCSGGCLWKEWLPCRVICAPTASGS